MIIAPGFEIPASDDRIVATAAKDRVVKMVGDDRPIVRAVFVGVAAGILRQNRTQVDIVGAHALTATDPRDQRVAKEDVRAGAIGEIDDRQAA